jgi:drug/metabolite transporter (DMT)-like permease
MNNLQKAHSALIVAGLLFGANYWVAKSTMPAFSPYEIVSFRIIIAALVLWLLGLFFPDKQKMSKKDLLRVFAAGSLGITLNQLLFFMGLEHSSPVETSILHTLSPLLVAAFAAWLLKESVTLRKIAGIIAGLTGAVIIVTSGKSLDFSNLHFTGNLLILSNIAAYSMYLILIKPVMAKHSPLQVTRYAFYAGLLTYAPFAAYHMHDASFSHVLPLEWLSLAYVVIGTTIITYMLTNFAMQKLPATVIGFYIYLQPFIATVIGYISGKEQLTYSGIIASVFLFTGVWLVIGGKHKKTNHTTQCDQDSG